MVALSEPHVCDGRFSCRYRYCVNGQEERAIEQVAEATGSNSVLIRKMMLRKNRDIGDMAVTLAVALQVRLNKARP